MQANNSGHSFAFRYIKLSVCNVYVVLVTNILHTYNLNRRKNALQLFISHCVLISRTKECLSQKCNIFRKNLIGTSNFEEPCRWHAASYKLWTHKY